MGWHANMASILVLFLVSLTLFSSVESTGFDCDPSANLPIINIAVNDPYTLLNAVNLKNTAVGSCTWNISKQIGTANWELDNIVLAPTDSITVIGYQTNEKNVTTSTTLYQKNGTPLAGLISVDNYNYFTIKLSVTANATVERVFLSVFYWNISVHLQKDPGMISFPLNSNNASIKTKFALHPGTQYDDRVFLFNFTQLPKTANLKIDGQTINASSPTIFLQTKDDVSIELDYTPVNGELIQARYWLVTRTCSGLFDLKLGESKPILFPNADYRNQRQLTAVRCGQYFSAPTGSKLQVLLEPNATGLASTGDALNFFDSQGALVLGLNNPALMYFKTIENFLEGNTALVFYESPYVSVVNPTFKAPELKAIPSTQASVLMLGDKDVTVSVKFDPKNPITHNVYPTNLGTSAKNVLAIFPNITIKPGSISIVIYNSETAIGTPIVTLGQFDRLPSAIASNSPIMRVVFSGDLKDPLSVTYRLVESSTSCQRLSTFSPNFEAHGGTSSAPCSWYIPESKTDNYTVINPTIVKIPAGKALTFTTFSKGGSKSQTIAGPVSRSYLPDVFLSPANAYEISVDTVNATKEDLHLLVAQKSDYLNETLTYQFTEKVSSVNSANYPGYYPLGVAENWFFNGPKTELALVTIQDVHLADAHTLSLVGNLAGSPFIFKGNANLTRVPDYLVPFPFGLTLDAKASNLNLTDLSNRGLKVDLLYPGVAAHLDISKETTIFFNSTTAVAGKPLSIWQVSANPKESSLSDTILHFNVTLVQGLDKTKASLKIYDSISLRPANLHYANGSITGTSGHFLGSIKSAFIVYDYSAAVAKSDLSATFIITPEKCTNANYTLKKCSTADRCITDLMVCNGIDECGDYSDELYCNGRVPPPPTPPAPAPASGGVNTLVVIFILMPMAAILGIVGYIYLPQFLVRIRRGRYSEFRDLSEVS